MKRCHNKNRNGFTLAEVLITLGIIGVVAALVIPVLNNKIQEQEFKTAYKKAFSEASQIWQTMRLNNEIEPCTSTYDLNCTSKNMITFRSYMKIVKSCGTNTWSDSVADCWDITGESANDVTKYGTGISIPRKTTGSGAIGFTDASGRNWIMIDGSSFGHNIIAVDTNGFKQPNKFGKDRQSMFGTLENGTYNVFVGTPVKLIPAPDYDSPNLTCGYPPCYGTSWLYK